MGKLRNIFLLGSLLLLLAACADDSEVEEATSEGEGEGENGGNGGGETMTLSFPGDVVSLDPHGSNDVPSEQVRVQIFEPLVDQNDEAEFEGVLAEDWEQVDDTTWRFNLREGVTFHDGSEFNADVVEANIDRIQDTAVASERGYLLEMIEEVEVVDDHTVELITEFPFSPLLGNLSHGAGGMMSEQQIDAEYEEALQAAEVDMTLDEYYEAREAGSDEYEDAAEAISSDIGNLVEQEPIGTGYMAFEDRSPGDSTTLTRNDEYWGESANIETAVFQVVPETGSRIAEIETESSDFASGVESSNIDRIESNEELTLDRTESPSIDYIGMNTDVEPLDDVRVRQAISHAFNSQEVLEGVYNGSGQPAEAPLAPGTLGYSEELDGLEYDMERAEELLAEAGYEDGFELEIMVNEESPERVDAAIWLQESLAEIGITLNVEQVEWGAFLETTANGEHELFTLGWVNTTGDPDNGIGPLFHSDNIGAEGNRSFYENEDLDALLEEGRSESDEDARQEIYEEAQQIIVEDAPAIFMRHGENLNAYHNGVEGIDINQDDLYDLRDVTIE